MATDIVITQRGTLARATSQAAIANNHGRFIGYWKQCPMRCKKQCVIVDSNRYKRSMSKLDFAMWLEQYNYIAERWVFSMPRFERFVCGDLNEIADSTMPAEMLSWRYELRALANKQWIRYVRAGADYTQAWQMILQ